MCNKCYKTKNIKNWLAYLFIIPIKAYQLFLSPWIGSNCRHQPTCSNYTILAIKEWGIFKGIYLGIKRILKCHPWGTSGYDPVPKNKNNNN